MKYGESGASQELLCYPVSNVWRHALYIDFLRLYGITHRKGSADNSNSSRNTNEPGGMPVWKQRTSLPFLAPSGQDSKENFGM